VLTEFGGGYDDWQRFNAQRLADKTTLTKTDVKAAPAKESPKPAANKLSFKEQKELEALPATIEALETEQTQLQASLADTALYRDKPEQVKTMQVRLQEIERAIENALARWETLEQKIV
jgi:ATP-binding cassette subfamily F protein uup